MMDHRHFKSRLIRLIEPLFFCGMFLFSVWLMIHTFSYDKTASEMHIATKAFSDFGASIPLIRSFSMGDNLARFFRGTVEYPLFPGEPIRYHYLFYMLVGILEKIGLRIDWALNIPSALGLFALMMLLYLLAKKLFHSVKVGVFTVVFFLFNGSLSFLNFFKTHPISLHTIQDVVTNNTFPSFAPWGPGPVSAFWTLNIYTNQRHLAFAFALALLFVMVLLWIEKKPLKKQAIFLLPEVIILAIMPNFHQPTLVILAVFMICYFVLFPRLRIVLAWIGTVAAFCIVPQIIPLLNGPKVIRWHPGYLISDQVTVVNFLWYWIHNLGLHFFLIPLGWLIAPARIKKVMIPLFFLFLVPNLFQFSVEMAANHKFFSFYLIIGAMLSASVIIRIFSLKHIGKLIGLAGLVGLIFSGIIDFFPIYNDGYMTLQDIPKNEVATWIRDNTPQDAVFLNSSYYFHPASLAGRKIFQGWPYFSWSAGYDTYIRDREIKQMYQTDDTNEFCRLISTYRITYITYQEQPEISEIHFSLNTLASHAKRVYANQTYSIWIPLCQ